MTDKKTLGYLERVWIAEINGHLPCQLHPATMQKLAAKGLVELVERRERMALGTLTIKGCSLTHLGRMLYCASCKDAEEPSAGDATP